MDRKEFEEKLQFEVDKSMDKLDEIMCGFSGSTTNMGWACRAAMLQALSETLRESQKDNVLMHGETFKRLINAFKNNVELEMDTAKKINE